MESSKPSWNDSQNVASQSRSQSQLQPQPQSQSHSSVKDGNASITDAVDEGDFVDLTDLFILLQRRDWAKVYEFLEEHPNSTRQTIHSKKGATPLLHLVLRHGPPLPVVNILLAHEARNDKTGKLLLSSSSSSLASTASSISSSLVWKQTDTSGRLPLHAACSCGPDASLDVISKLISADPEALRIRTKDEHGRFPLHLAVVTNATEDVVMELMIHCPDASFRMDSHGKLPIEYAQDSCYGHNRLVVALESAPMFLAASQAAYTRVTKATESKLNSLRGAYATYEEQLEGRHKNEKMALIQEQIQCSNQLANEKERNIFLAEAMLEMKESETNLILERDDLKSKLDREILIRNTRAQLREDELKQILLGAKSEDSGEGLQGENENKNENCNKNVEETAGEDQTEQGGSDNSIIISEGVDVDADVDVEASSSGLPLPRLLQRVSDGFESSKRRNELYKKNLERQRASTRKLNTLLAAKEVELKQASRRSRCDEVTLQAAIDRAEDLSEKHETVLAKLSNALEEIERLKQIDSEREQKLAHSERRLRIQGKRLSGVQDLIESLNLARAANADRLGLIQEETERDGADGYVEVDTSSDDYTNSDSRSSNAREHNCSGTIAKAAELSIDLSVEIEMAAMAAAQLDDGASTSSVNSSASARRRQADLSVELAAVTSMDYDRRPTHERKERASSEAACSNRENYFRRAMIKTFEEGTFAKPQQPMNRIGTNWDMDKGANCVRGTPQTMSTTTVTTASCCEDGSGDDSMDISKPETPPVPEQVNSRSRRECDQCSPLGSPKLDFMRDS